MMILKKMRTYQFLHISQSSPSMLEPYNKFLKCKYVTDDYFLEFPTKTFWFCVMK